MSATTLHPFTMNETSSFIDLVTNLDNFTNRNLSGLGDEVGGVRSATIERDMYRQARWAIILCTLVAGVAGNILVFAMMTDRKLKFLSYSVYLKFLAVSDSLVLSISLIEDTEITFTLERLIIISSALCKMVTSFRNLVMTLSPWLMVGLTLDRFVCICFPLKRETLCTQLKALVVCSAMVVFSFASVVPFLAGIELTKRRCVPTSGVKYYYLLLRLMFGSSIPCIFMLILNMLTIIQIQRGNRFRKTFMTSRTDAANRQQDSSTRPLVLISVLAFVTLLPLSVCDALEAALKIADAPRNVVEINRRVRSFSILIYVLNFGQNFYILIGSSKNYREIIKRKLECGGLKWWKSRNTRASTHTSATASESLSHTPALSHTTTASEQTTSPIELNT